MATDQISTTYTIQGHEIIFSATDLGPEGVAAQVVCATCSVLVQADRHFMHLLTDADAIAEYVTTMVEQRHADLLITGVTY